jgi:hypothetical protein
MSKPPRRTASPRPLLALMEHWPVSWGGVAEDKPFGAGLVAELRPFVTHLQTLGLAPKTVHRHLDNLWVIGGEILRRLNDDPQLRNTSPRQLLLDTVADGEAPFVADASEADQRSFDATACRLLRFITTI